MESNDVQEKDVPEITTEDITESVDKIVKYHVLGSMGVGLIPIPLADMVVLTGLQLNMLRKLANTYNIPFSKDAGKHAIATLIGASVPVAAGAPAASLIKTIPIIGQTVGVLVMPAFAGAMTYALGKVFVQHFESGGTFLNFKPEEVKAHFAELLKEGKEKAKKFGKTAEKETEVVE